VEKMPSDDKAHRLVVDRGYYHSDHTCGGSAFITINAEGVFEEIAFIAANKEINEAVRKYAAEREVDEEGTNALIVMLVFHFNPTFHLLSDYLNDDISVDVKRKRSSTSSRAPLSPSFFALPRVFNQLKFIGRSKKRRLVGPDL
jgi:hypothetical protein